MHRAQPRIEIAPAPVAIERHRQPALRAFDANHARIAGSRRFTVLVCTMWSYCCQTQRLPQMFGLPRSCLKLLRQIAAPQ